MPALKYKEKLHDNLWIGVQVGKGVKGTGRTTKGGDTVSVGKGVWTAEIRFTGEPRVHKTTKIKYEPESEYSRQQAIKKAYEIFQPFAERAANNIPINAKYTVLHLAEKYLRDIEQQVKENENRIREGYEPTQKIDGGRTYWNEYSEKRTLSAWNNHIWKWVKSLKPSRNEAGKLIQEFTQRDADAFDDWLKKNSPTLSPESRLKYGTEVNHFISWAYEERYINTKFKVARTSRGGVPEARKRMRKEITEDMYTDMMRWIKNRIQDKERPLHYRQYNYLFYSWFILCANTGIRPPSGTRDHTIMYWGDLKIDGDFEKSPLLHRPNEKGHDYEAIIMPRAAKQIRRLKKFYEELGVSTSDEKPVFQHIQDQKFTYSKKYDYERDNGKTATITRESSKYGQYRWRKGDPIKSFKGTWDKMCEEIGANPPRGTSTNRTPQSQRVSPSSLRAWFITQRLYSSGKIEIEKLSRVTGTSINQIEIRYARLDAARSYDVLSAGGYDDGDAEEVYVDGMYIGTKDSKFIRGD